MTDMINHPAHYCEGRKFEPIDVIDDWGLNYRLGCALKYIARAGRKDPSKAREDLQKCAWYIEREIASLDAPSGSYVPDEEGVYDEILTYYGQSVDLDEAWPETERLRVYELARELGVTNEVIFDATDELGISVRSHSSALRGRQIEEVRQAVIEKQVPFDLDNDVPVFNLSGFRPVRTEASVFLDKATDRVTDAEDEDWADFWDSDDDYMWDPSLGPVELTEEEISAIISGKDLSQFEDGEIVSTINRRGLIIGVKKDGSTVILSDGQ